MAEERIHATGRRKVAVATIWLSPGSGKWQVNGRELLPYLTRQSLVIHATDPFRLTEMERKVDIFCKVRGGGLSGQAGAIRLALARALIKLNPEFRKQLKKAGMLTRDPRMVERKKYGLVKARKRFQFSKR
ncbi:MAG: 30S ribosomal protein S9 [candidate division Zixibacteria bacterium]|nr:30S ribosomal protein S9 [candidate division Zixibacteria bacterium]